MYFVKVKCFEIVQKNYIDLQNYKGSTPNLIGNKVVMMSEFFVTI